MLAYKNRMAKLGAKSNTSSANMVVMHLFTAATCMYFKNKKGRKWIDIEELPLDQLNV